MPSPRIVTEATTNLVFSFEKPTISTTMTKPTDLSSFRATKEPIVKIDDTLSEKKGQATIGSFFSKAIVSTKSTARQEKSLSPMRKDKSNISKKSSKQATVTVSLDKHFESSVESATPKVSKFAHDSTWMTPLTFERPGRTNSANETTQTKPNTAITSLFNSSLHEPSIGPGTPYSKESSTIMTPTQIFSPISSLSLEKNTNLTTEHDAIENLSIQRQDLKRQYDRKKENLIRRALEECISENFSSLQSLPSPSFSENKSIDSTSDTFPEEFIKHLCVIVQGSQLSLSKLSNLCHSKLKKLSPCITELSISSKIKILAKRTSYMSNALANSNSTVNFYEDTDPLSLWFWELSSPQILLPDSYYEVVKKSRSTRRKMLHRLKAIDRLLTTILDPNSSDASVSTEEEKVLKYEREEERQRLALEAKKEKEKKRLERDTEKKMRLKEKEKKIAERKEKEALKLKKLKEKEEERQSILRTKELEKKKKQEEIELKKEQINKQKQKMLSFFKSSSNTTNKQNVDKKKLVNSPNATLPQKATSVEEKFNVGAFRKLIDSQSSNVTPSVRPLTHSAVESRRRKKKLIPISVMTTTESSAFQQSYSERKIIYVPNKLKFLFFKEDLRPPYRGTWSKKSNAVTGRTPFGKDDNLDYDFDSEAEWEEEAEDGEDVDNDDNSETEDVDEEGNTREYNYKDDWLMEDGEFQVDDEQDGDANQMRKRNEETKKKKKSAINICYISPKFGGLPPDLTDMKVEGIDIKDAKDMFCDLRSNTLVDGAICLDCHLKEESKSPLSPKLDSKISSPEAKSIEMTKDELREFCRFVHKSDFKSKEKLVEELRKSHPNITTSRAQATRKLDSIALKKKLDMGTGVVWEVRMEVLKELGLNLEQSTEDDNMKIFCEFVHNCELNSKEKVVDELLSKYPELTSSRARAVRKLDSIADKKKTAKGYAWKVKSEILMKLKLDHLIRKECEELQTPGDSKGNEKQESALSHKKNKIITKNADSNKKRKPTKKDSNNPAETLMSSLKEQSAPRTILNKKRKEENGIDNNVRKKDSIQELKKNPIALQETKDCGIVPASCKKNLEEQKIEKTCTKKKSVNASAKFFASFLKMGSRNKKRKKATIEAHNKNKDDENVQQKASPAKKPKA